MTIESIDIESPEYKKEIKIIMVATIILIILVVILAIAKAPHYTPEQIVCMKKNPLEHYICGV